MFTDLFNSVFLGKIALIRILYFIALFPEIKKKDKDLLTPTRIYY